MRLPVDPERGDEVLVQLEPDPVAGVDVAAVDPASVSVLGAASRDGEPRVVPLEPGQEPSEPVGERDEVVLDRGRARPRRR